MKDYSDIGLTDKLQSITSIPGKEKEQLAVEMESLGFVRRQTSGPARVTLAASGTAPNPGTVLDQSGTAIIDNFGLVSVTNFRDANTIASGINQNFTGTTYSDVTNSEYTFVLDREAVVYFPFSFNGYTVEPGTHTCDFNVGPNLNGTAAAGGRHIFLLSGNASGITVSNYWLIETGPGTQTFKLEAKLDARNGTASATIRDFQESYIVFGK